MRNVTFSIFRASKGRAPAQWSMDHDRYLQRIYYIRSGNGCIVFDNGIRQAFEPGKLYIMPANMTYKCETSPENRIDHIYFDYFSTPPIIAEAPLIYDVSEGSPLKKHIELMDRVLYDRTDPRNHNYICSGRMLDTPDGSIQERFQLIGELLYTLLLLLSMIKPIPFTDDSAVIDTLDYITRHYSEKITLEMLADRAGLNKIYFIRRFKRVMSVTPYAYLRSYRLARAHELISCGETYAEAAKRVGYMNASSLYYELHK